MNRRGPARRRRVSVRGTLGILVEAKRRGEIPEVAPVVNELRSRGVWLSERLVGRILVEVGESDLGA